MPGDELVWKREAVGKTGALKASPREVVESSVCGGGHWHPPLPVERQG